MRTATAVGLAVVFALAMSARAAELKSGPQKGEEIGAYEVVKVAGNPGWEKWNSSSKGGELNAFVNKRFVVQIEGRHLDDTKVLYQLADAMQLGKLASLK